MATREDHPGWFYMIRNGATSIWEVWDALTQINHSRNHPAFGAIGAWFYQSLAGIQPDAEGPGFKKIIIKPEVMTGLNWAKASYNSIQGEIVSDWKRKGNEFFLEIKIPVNTTATVYMPASDLGSISEGNRPASQFSQMEYLRQEDNIFIFEIGSGNYQFMSSLNK